MLTRLTFILAGLPYQAQQMVILEQGFPWRWLSSRLLHHVVWWKLTDISEVLAASIIRAILIALMMGATRTSEMFANFYHTTWRNIWEDSYLHTRLHENLKSYQGLPWLAYTYSTVPWLCKSNIHQCHHKN
jgi:hypothetical protein